MLFAKLRQNNVWKLTDLDLINCNPNLDISVSGLTLYIDIDDVI